MCKIKSVVCFIVHLAWFPLGFFRGIYSVALDHIYSLSVRLVAVSIVTGRGRNKG